MNAFDENYGLAEGPLGKLYGSKTRAKILDSLEKGGASLADLARRIRTNPPNVAANLRELEELCLIEKKEGRYGLTKWGEAAKSRIDENVGMIAAFEKYKEFWASRDLEKFPLEFMANIGVLLDSSEIVRNYELDVLAVHEKFCRYSQSAKEKFYEVSPLYDNAYKDIGVELVRKGIKIKFVTTRKVLDQLISEASEGERESVASSRNTEFYLLDYNPKVSLCVSDAGLVLTFPPKSDEWSYMDMDLYNYSPAGIEWGMKLFDWYRGQAKPIRLRDYL